MTLEITKITLYFFSDESFRSYYKIQLFENLKKKNFLAFLVLSFRGKKHGALEFFYLFCLSGFLKKNL